MSWHNGPLLAWDLETTSADPETARIVTATVAWIHGGQVEPCDWLVNPGIEISPEATAIHGVTNEMAVEGVDPATACAQIWAELVDGWHGGRPVIGYNVSYDFTVLDREMRRHCGTHIEDVLGPVIDPYVIDKALDRYRRGSRTLSAAVEHYRVTLTDAHSSLGDCLGAARVAWRLAQRYPAELTDLAALHEKQKQWKADQAASFRTYLEKRGEDSSEVRGDWPMVPYVPTPACESVDA